MKKAVFLDRDGTIIRDVIYLNDPTKIEIYPESYEALKLLNDHGFLIVLATNQSGVAKGIVDEKNVILINQMIMDTYREQGIEIHDAYYCPHPVDGGCECRKPNAGMLKRGAEKFGIDLKQSWMVGDRMSDVEAGIRAGSQSILLQNDETPPIDPQYSPPKTICRDVLEAAKFIVEQSSKGSHAT